MKKTLLLLISSFLMFSLSACSGGVSHEDHNALLDSYTELENRFADLNDDYEALQDELDSVQDEYKSYKEKMEPYENLDAAEAEARQIEADKVIAEQRAAEEAAEAEAAALLAAEEAKGYETGITFDNIARNPDDYKDKKVKFTGKVVQVIENGSSIQIRLAINKDYNKIVYCEYDASIVASRVLEDDIITIYGVSAGTISYKSTMGGQITIPAILIDRIDQ